MKILSVFLSIYIFYLVSIPCVDDTLQLNNPASGQTTQQDQGSHSDHGDACSPFCICSCCSVTVTITSGISVNPPFFTLLDSYTPETSHFISSYSPFFWQPPKIS